MHDFFKYTSLMIILSVFCARYATAGAGVRFVGYFLYQDGPNVFICPNHEAKRKTYNCPDKVLVRQNVSTGELKIVQTKDCIGIMESKKITSGYREMVCYIDKCVKSGTYRYGLVPSYSCQDNEGEFHVTHFYEEIAVKAKAACQSPSQNRPFTGKIPWKNNKIKCENQPFLGCLCSASHEQRGSGQMLWLLAGLCFVGWRRRWKRRHR